MKYTSYARVAMDLNLCQNISLSDTLLVKIHQQGQFGTPTGKSGILVAISRSSKDVLQPILPLSGPWRETLAL